MKSNKWYKGLTATAIALALAGAAAIPAYAGDAEEMNDTGITTSTFENETTDQAADAVIDKAADAVIDKVIDGNVNWGETDENGQTVGKIGENGEGGGVGRTETDGNTTTDEKYDENKASTSVSGPSYVDENGNTVTPTTTVTPGTKETTTEGKGEISGELPRKEEVKENNTDIKADFDGVNFDHITDGKINDKNGKEYNVTDNGDGKYTLTREENLEGKLGDEDIAKLLNGYVKNEDGSYTKVDGDTTTVITITGNTVNRRVQTTLTVSTKETKKDSEDQTGTVTDKTTGNIKDTAGSDLNVSGILEKAKKDGATVEKDANGNITKFTDTDGKVYEFTYESGEGTSVDPSTLNADQLAGLLGDGYTVVDGKIIFTDANGSEHEITLDDAKSELIKKTVKVTVKTKEKHEESDKVKESIEKEAEKAALAEAKKKAAQALGIDEGKFTLKAGTTDTYVYTDESGKTYSFKLTAVKKPDSQGDMSEEDKSKIDGFEYGTKFTITYESTASDSTIVTPGQKDLGNAPFELDENGNIKGATKVDDTHYTITKVENGKTYTYTITIADITDVSGLTDEEKALLEGSSGEELGNLSLKRYSWTSTASYDDVVENGGVHEKEGSYIEKGEGNTFIYHDKDGNTISGLKKNDDGSYSYTDADHVKHTYTVSERDMTTDEIKAMLEKAGYTDVVLGEDGKATGKKGGADVDITYTPQKITDITVKSEDGGAFNSREELINWIKGEVDKLQEGETLKFGEKEIPKGTEITWEFIKDEVESVTNFSQMSDQEIISLLKKQQQTAKDNNNYYDGSEGKWVDGYYEGWWPFGEWVDGHWEKNPNYIGHLDLATDANLTLTDKTKTDCILIEKNLEWNYDADKLVKGEGNTKVGLSNNISYDNEDGTDGHYEYPRASWDGSSKKNDKNPEKSAFYKLTGTIAYGTDKGIDGEYRDGWYTSGEKAAKKALQDYINEKTKGLSAEDAERARAKYKNAQVVRIYDDQQYNRCHYKIYLYTAELTTYGYMDKDGNTCVNKDFKRQDSSTSTEYVGGYDLTISELTQTSDGKVIGQGGSTTSYSGKLTKSKKDNGKQSMTVNAVKEGSERGESGSAIKGGYTLTETLDDLYATGSGSYNEYTVSKTGSAQGESYDGNVLYTYKVHDKTVINPEADLRSETVTLDNFRLNYKYTKTTVEEIEKKEEGTIVIPPTPIIIPGEKEDIIIREDDPPLTPAPEPSEDVTIDDEETPLTPAPIPDDVIDEIIMEIEDEVVPLASVPKTGEAGNAAAAAAGGALAGLAFLAFLRKRKSK